VPGGGYGREKAGGGHDGAEAGYRQAGSLGDADGVMLARIDRAIKADRPG